MKIVNFLICSIIAFNFSEVALSDSKAGKDSKKEVNSNLEVDLAASTVGWEAKKITGGHNGHLKFKSGSVEFKGKELVAGKLEVDMNSLTVEDIPAGDKKNADLIGHLKSDDFFSVQKHPVSMFKITSVKAVTGKPEATHEISGELTIKGKTEPVSFPAKISHNSAGKHEAMGKLTVDRTKFDVKYRSLKFFADIGDKAINDNFWLNLKITTK